MDWWLLELIFVGVMFAVIGVLGPLIKRFGKAYAAFTVEAGARISQSLYVSSFMDAGNVYRTAPQWDPTRLFRGAGFGVALVSPLGPIGVDFAYGFDKKDASGNPTPGWQLHFKVGNFF